MKFLTIMIAMCAIIHASWAGDEKQIKLEDIERDSLIEETDGSEPEQKELPQQPTQHIQLSYSNDPQDIFVTPQPRYPSNDSPSDLRTQLYHLPKVHESDQTYTVPAKQTLIQPVIGGSQPIQPLLGPQPQYIYVQSPHQAQSYMPQAHAYVMVPYASQYPQQQSSVHYPQQQSSVHYPQQQSPVHYSQQQAPLQIQQSSPIHVQQQNQHQVISHPQAPTPTAYSYSHGHHQPTYQAVKSIDYTIPSQSTPLQALQTSVDYKTNAHLPIVPRKTLPSIATTSFQQFYSPGLEYHYTEAHPVTKLSPHSSYSYQNAPTHNYHTNYVSQAPSYSQYFQAGPSSITPSYNKHQSTGLLDSYVPSLVTYGRQHQHQQQQQLIQQLPQHQTQFKNYYPTQYQQSHHQFSSSPQIPQQLFTPSQSSSSYMPYPSPQAYNTIQYSVPLPPYDHSKRSTSKATATLSVKAPKSN